MTNEKSKLIINMLLAYEKKIKESGEETPAEADRYGITKRD